MIQRGSDIRYEENRMDCSYGTRPLWFWNDLPTEESIREIMENCSRQDGYAGFGILPYKACGLQYMSDEYLRLYGVVLREARRLKLKMCLYDEWWFPSGGAGGIDDFKRLFHKIPKVSAGLAASIFHFGEVEINELKRQLAEDGISVRL